MLYIYEGLAGISQWEAILYIKEGALQVILKKIND